MLAALSAVLTAVGHVAGGGAVPDLAVLVVLAPLLAGGFVGVAERCRSAAGTVGTLAAGQFALHHLMVLLHPAHQPGDSPAPSGAAMIGMHAAVTLVTAIALRHADDAVAAVLAALRRTVPRRLVPPPAEGPLPTLTVPGPAVPARLARALAGAHVRRGPPLGC